MLIKSEQTRIFGEVKTCQTPEGTAQWSLQ